MSTTEKHEVKGRLTNAACREREYVFPADGSEIEPELLEHMSPLSWEHIGLTGDYVWKTNKLPKQGEYRELND